MVSEGRARAVGVYIHVLIDKERRMDGRTRHGAGVRVKRRTRLLLQLPPRVVDGVLLDVDAVQLAQQPLRHARGEEEPVLIIQWGWRHGWLGKAMIDVSV